MKLSHFCIFAFLLLSACARSGSFEHPNASGRYVPDIEQCVPYARRISGIELYGDADSWWYKAEGRYARGHIPAPGAVLVLKQTPRMRSGHVAVVKDIIGTRQIHVSHSNWGSDGKSRRMIYDAMLAEDVSPANDWSEVRFWNFEKNVLGFPYAAHGFIYK